MSQLLIPIISQHICTGNQQIYTVSSVASAKVKEWLISVQSASSGPHIRMTAGDILDLAMKEHMPTPCFDQAFMLQVDASQVGAGAVLLQKDDQGVAYDFDIQHIKGTDNVMADALSRAPLP
ncbi:hypothetical protein L3Q82_012022 [Scortum barcoo]|uniref:Uncharacterized protein n=1 Tax=Scortum barcoo TaxID=214431 RepID=A0ACB8W6V3_9TELE|nr:hypothetical protein L3Q82_012022 [Scortum barcoo]